MSLCCFIHISSLFLFENEQLACISQSRLNTFSLWIFIFWCHFHFGFLLFLSPSPKSWIKCFGTVCEPKELRSKASFRDLSLLCILYCLPVCHVVAMFFFHWVLNVTMRNIGFMKVEWQKLQEMHRIPWMIYSRTK